MPVFNTLGHVSIKLAYLAQYRSAGVKNMMIQMLVHDVPAKTMVGVCLQESSKKMWSGKHKVYIVISLKYKCTVGGEDDSCEKRVKF